MAPSNALRSPVNAVASWPVRFLRDMFPRKLLGRKLARSERGESLVGFALTFPVMFGFIFGLMQVCLAFYTYEWISESAREGTRYAIVHGSTCVTSGGSSCTATAAQVGTYIGKVGLPNLGGGTMSVDTVTADMFPDGDEAPGHHVKVQITYAFPYKIPFVLSRTLTMSSTSQMSIIQ